MENPHLPVWACKLLQFTERSIGPTMEICVNSGLPIVVVPCLHQTNVYIKRKLRGWRVNKCTPLVGVKTVLTCAGLQTTPVHGRHYRAENGNLRKFGSTNRHRTVLHQSNVYIKRKLRGWRAQKCIPLVGTKPVLTCAVPQTTPVYGGHYRAENGNLCKFGFTYRHGSMFPPKQCLYQKKTKGMESPKMYSLSRWKTPLTCASLQTTPVHGAQYRADNGNLYEFGSTYRHGTVAKAIFISKES